MLIATSHRVMAFLGQLLAQAPEPDDTLPPMVPADPGSLLERTVEQGPQVPGPLLGPAVALWTLILGIIVLVAITVFLWSGVGLARAGSDDVKAANSTRGMGRSGGILLGIMVLAVIIAIILAIVSLINGG